MSPEEIKTIAHLLAGHEPGWQTRFATLLGISRGYAHNLLTGERPMPGKIYIKLVIAVRKAAEESRVRTGELDELAVELGAATMGETAAMPEQLTREEYERQADEAEAMVNEMAGLTSVKEGRKS